jgi:hypothetical protein
LLLPKKNGGFIIADDRFIFWKVFESSLFLKITKKIAANIIYVRPLGNQHADLHRIPVVIAQPALINKIREIAGEENHQFYYSRAYAINLLLNRKSYQTQVHEIHLALKDLKMLIHDIFSASGIWKEYGIRLDSGAAIYLEPKQGKFASDVYHKLMNEQIYVVDPASYLKQAENVVGLRLQLSYLIGKKNIDHHLKKVNKLLLSLIETTGDV